jgi:hypothetical protein
VVGGDSNYTDRVDLPKKKASASKKEIRDAVLPDFPSKDGQITIKSCANFGDATPKVWTSDTMNPGDLVQRGDANANATSRGATW